MTNELAAVNGADESKDKIPHDHVDAEDDNDEGEEDGAPEIVGAGGECFTWNPSRIDCTHVYHVGEGKKKKKKKKSKKKKVAAEQSEPPRVGLSKLFPDGNYPEGELQDYKDE